MRWRVIDGVAGKAATCSLGLECTRLAWSEMVISAKYFAESQRKKKDRKKQRKKWRLFFFFVSAVRPSFHDAAVDQFLLSHVLSKFVKFQSLRL